SPHLGLGCPPHRGSSELDRSGLGCGIAALLAGSLLMPNPCTFYFSMSEYTKLDDEHNERIQAVKVDKICHLISPSRPLDPSPSVHPAKTQRKATKDAQPAHRIALGSRRSFRNVSEDQKSRNR